jgi:diguanylate cyclase (GGDEF)-like protein/PAS domain S-box-containing protein
VSDSENTHCPIVCCASLKSNFSPLAKGIIVRSSISSDIARPSSRLTLTDVVSAEINLFNAFESISDAVIITDTNLEAPGPKIVYVNPAFERLSGYKKEDTLGRNPRFMQGPKTSLEVRERIRASLLAERSVIEEIVNYDLHGTAYWVQINIEPLRDDTGKITHFIATQRDISARKRIEEELRFRANCDALTGIPNRAQFLEHLEQVLSEATRHGHQLGVAMMDLDRFKYINDTYGHATGDTVLKTVSERLKRLMRDSDLVGRLGGDEFAFLIVEPKSRKEVTNAMQRIASAISDPIKVGTRTLEMTGSIGISMYPKDAGDSGTLLHHADMAMYDAKSQGRNNVQVFHPEIKSKADKELNLERRLRQAVKNASFVLNFQPVHDQTGKLVSFEALLRWNDAKLGPIEPDVFIPLAEQNGLIHQLDRWVLQEACRQAAAMQLPSSLRIAVNISPSAFNQARLIDEVQEALDASGLPASMLRLEITEQAMLSDFQTCNLHLTQLRALGIEVAVDDFGTGYANLKHLVALQMDIVKIDRFFVHGLESDPRAQALVKGVIELAHQLGYKVVGEGVETVAERDALLKLGCDQVQGFLLAKPMSVADTSDYLQRHHSVWNCSE